MKFFRFLAAGTLVLCACSVKAPEPVVTPDMEQALLAGFDAIMTAHEKCDDMDAFIQMHTSQAQAAMSALDSLVDPGFLDPGQADVTQNRGALWVCLVANKAGLTKSGVKVVRHVIDPRSKLARVIFSLRDGEYAFPMARQDGTWRSPFPGQLFLAAQYTGWVNEIKSKIPEASRDGLLDKLRESTSGVKGFQPNWALYPELDQKESDEVQLRVKENVRKAVGQ